MWRELDVGGIYMPPLLAYLAASLAVFLPLRWLLVRAHLLRWAWNPPLAEMGLFVCILGALIGLL